MDLHRAIVDLGTWKAVPESPNDGTISTDEQNTTSMSTFLPKNYIQW